MSRLTIGSIIILSIVLSNSAARATVQMNKGGEACVAENQESYGKYVAGDGILNASNSSYLDVACPIDWLNSYADGELLAADGGYVFYKDGNATNSVAGEVVCRYVGRDVSGDLYDFPEVCSCSTSGGCTSGCSSGNTHVTSGRDYLGMAAPTESYWDNMTLECGVPATDPMTFTASFIVGYSMLYESGV